MRRVPLQIKLIRCRKPFTKKNSKTLKFVLGVTKANERGFVYDRIAVYDKKSKKFSINVFKLIQWLGRDVRLTGNAMMMLEKFGILQTHETKKTSSS
jgi:hypothetical protein